MSNERINSFFKCKCIDNKRHIRNDNNNVCGLESGFRTTKEVAC